MATTYIGRDNNGKPCYHVRKGDNISVANMKAGVQDDTLFHSSLPYLHVVHSATATKTSTLSHNAPANISNSAYYVTQNIDIFSIPSSVRTYLQSGSCCIAVATYSDGSKGMIDFSPKLLSYKHKFANSVVTARTAIINTTNANGPGTDNFGWLALDYIPTSYPISQGTGLTTTTFPPVGSRGYLNTNNAAINLTLAESASTHLNSLSQCLVFTRCNGDITKPGDADYWWLPAVKAVAPTPTSVEFMVLNMTSLDATLTFAPLAPNATDIKMFKGGFLVGGTDILKGKTFLSLDKPNITSGSTVDAASFTGCLKLTTTTSYPFSYPSAFVLANDGGSNTITCTNAGAPLLLGNYAGTINRNLYYQVYNVAPASDFSTAVFTNVIDAELTKYNTDTFKKISIPSAISSCEVSQDTLKINGLTMFSSNTPIIYPASTSDVPIIVPSYSISANSVSEKVVLNTFNIAKPASRFILIYHTNYFNSTNYTSSDSVTGCSLTIDFNRRQSKPNLGMHLVTLSEGQSCLIARFEDTFDIQNSSGVETRGSRTITYMFKRVGNTIQLIRDILVIKTGTNTYSCTIPGFQINYVQLASAF